MSVLFKSPTIEQIAAYLREGISDVSGFFVPLKAGGSGVPTFLVHSIIGDVVTLYSNRGLAVLSFQYCPRFNCKVIALKSRIFVVKSRTKFAMKFVRDLNAKDTSVGDGGRVRPSALCPRFEYKDALKSAI
jgi:hypothetical protein